MHGTCAQKPSRLILVTLISRFLFRMPGEGSNARSARFALRQIFKKSSRRLEIIPKQVTKSSQKWLGLRCTAGRSGNRLLRFPAHWIRRLAQSAFGCTETHVTFFWCWRGIVSPFNTIFLGGAKSRCGRGLSLPRLGRGRGYSLGRRCAARRGHRRDRARRGSCSRFRRCSRGRS
jgi:hypothetical protein